MASWATTENFIFLVSIVIMTVVIIKYVRKSRSGQSIRHQSILTQYSSTLATTSSVSIDTVREVIAEWVDRPISETT